MGSFDEIDYHVSTFPLSTFPLFFFQVLRLDVSAAGAPVLPADVLWRDVLADHGADHADCTGIINLKIVLFFVYHFPRIFKLYPTRAVQYALLRARVLLGCPCLSGAD